MGKVYVGDVGTEILIDMQEDLTSATSITWNIQKPNGSSVVWVPSVINTRFLRYYAQAGDLNVNGVYRIQPHLTIGTWTGSSTDVEFTVFSIL